MSRGPIVLIIRVLEACNAGCFMCAFAHSDDAWRFGPQDARDLVGTLRGGSVRLVRFTGGEPLLVEDLPEIVGVFREGGIATSVITNGMRLAPRVDELYRSGLAQVIVSLDGPDAATHDRFRRLPGLFEAAVAGVRAARSLGILVRVNTVLGPHNISDLLRLWSVLRELKVDQWSLIPLKRANAPWRLRPVQLEQARRHLEAIGAAQCGPRILGYGLQIFGRDAAEVLELSTGTHNMRPRVPCGLVDQVRYYTPRDGVVFPCNCLPHRDGEILLSESVAGDSFSGSGLKEVREWLHRNAHQTCTGCEPVNAALAEGAIDLGEDLFGY